MDYASPAVQLLGTLTSIVVHLLVITAAIFFLRERATGAWLMLAGAAIALLGFSIPQIIYVAISFFGSEKISPPIESLMYYSIWPWFSVGGALLFAIGLMLVALRRRALTNRIAELELLLSVRENQQR